MPEDKRVYLRGFGYAEDPAHVADHPDLWRSPAMATASASALGGAGIGIDDVAHFDLYSCFASSVNFALDALGLSEDDPRGVTQTGGLPYHGGPGSNYMTHSIAAMAETLRADPGSYGVTSGVGMHMQKHAYGLWSTAPGVVRTRERPRSFQPGESHLDRRVPRAHGHGGHLFGAPRPQRRTRIRRVGVRPSRRWSLLRHVGWRLGGG